MPLEIRDYQNELIDRTLNAFKESNAVLLQMPTGTGKTVVFCEILNQFYRSDVSHKRILILVHRIELVDQIKDTFNNWFHSISRTYVLSKGAKKALKLNLNSNFPKKTNSVVIISMVQTMVNAIENIDTRNVGMIIVDECHHVRAKTYETIINKIISDNSKTKLLGVTATPIRMDGKGFRRIFSKLVKAEGILNFIKNGFLSKYEHFSSRIIKIRREERVKYLNSRHEFNDLKIEPIYSTEDAIAEVINSYKTLANGKKSIVYAINKSHAEILKQKFLGSEFSQIDYITSDTPIIDRKRIIKDFKESRINILINVDILTEGFDLPSIECVILARPTMSLVKYLQMIGRAIRIDPDKPDSIVTILDLANNSHYHGFLSTHREWDLKNDISTFKEIQDEEIIEISRRNTHLREIKADLIFMDSSERPYENLNEEITVAKDESIIYKVEIERNILGQFESVELNFNNLVSVFGSLEGGDKIWEIPVFQIQNQIICRLTDNSLHKIRVDNNREDLKYYLESSIQKYNEGLARYNDYYHKPYIKFNKFCSKYYIPPLIVRNAILQDAQLKRIFIENNLAGDILASPPRFTFNISKYIADRLSNHFNLE
jgi:superfamily II DNA or RNA helicase